MATEPMSIIPTDSPAEQMRRVWSVEDIQLAAAGIKASIICKRKTNEPDAEASAVLLMLTARDLGLPPVATLPQMHIIEGNVTISSHLMLALIARSGLGTVDMEHGDGWCEVTMTRHDGHIAPYTSRWDRARAETAGVLGKANWQKHEGPMLRARGIGECAKIVFPDVVFGLYTPQEFDHTDYDAEESEWAPRVVDTSTQNGDFEAEPVDRIGHEGSGAIFAVLKDVAGKTGRGEKQLVAEVKERASAHGGRVTDLTEAQGQEIVDWLTGLLTDEPAPAEADDEFSDTFPKGGDTTVSEWRETCSAQGIRGKLQHRLQLHTFGTVQPPESPDDMGELVDATLALMRGDLTDLPELPPVAAPIEGADPLAVETQGAARRLFEKKDEE